MVTFKLYDSIGTTLLYTFPIVFQANYPHTEKEIIEHKNIRANGSVIVEGGNSPWDLTLRGVLSGSDYDTLMTLVNALESAVVINTPYVLKIVSTGGTTYSYNVKRITPITYPEDNLRTDLLEYTITLRVLSWA